MADQNYSDGTAVVVNGSTAVIGNGTAWDLSLVAGGLFTTAIGVAIPIASVTDDTHLVLEFAYPGPSASLAYSIFRETAQSASAIIANDRLASITQRLESGTFLQPDATGTLAERAQWDEERQDFVYIQSDVDPFLVYIKRSDSDGDWSSPGQPLRVAGTPGTPGTNGIGDRYSVVLHDPGRAGAGEVVFEMIFDTTVSFPLNQVGSQAKAGIAATASAVWSVKKNGVQVWTVTWSAAGTTGAFAGAATTFIAGDLMTVTGPNPRDATLSNVKMTFAGTR